MRFGLKIEMFIAVEGDRGELSRLFFIFYIPLLNLA